MKLKETVAKNVEKAKKFASDHKFEIGVAIGGVATIGLNVVLNRVLFTDTIASDSYSCTDCMKAGYVFDQRGRFGNYKKHILTVVWDPDDATEVGQGLVDIAKELKKQ